jgi:hypothetical protein
VDGDKRSALLSEASLLSAAIALDAAVIFCGVYLGRSQ